MVTQMCSQHSEMSRWELTICFQSHPCLPVFLAVFICLFNDDYLQAPALCPCSGAGGGTTLPSGACHSECRG